MSEETIDCQKHDEKSSELHNNSLDFVFFEKVNGTDMTGRITRRV